MTRRIGVAIVGMVVAALVLAGLGTILLASIGNRQASEDDLRDQAEVLASLFGELTLAPGQNGDPGNARERLNQVSRTLSVEGVGLLVVPRAGVEPIGELPDGVELADLDIDALTRGESVSGRKGDLVFAAAAGRSRAGFGQVLVLTERPDSVIAPAFGWFLLAGVITILFAFLVTLRLSRTLTRPIRQASATTTRIAGGDLGARIPESEAEVGGEVAELVHSVNTMADTLDRSRHLERQFLLSVSHDLRTPLTSIRGYAEALTDGAVDDPAAVGSVIESESKRLERLVGDLLLLARLEGTGFAFDIDEHHAAEIVEDTAHGFEPDADDRGIELSVRVPDMPTQVMVDPDRYAQIVSNLVGNALRFADSAVAVTLWRAEGRVHLAVADDGPGISDADLPHVFERLYVSQHNPKVRESGSGLGLAIVRELTEGMGGTVVARRSDLGGAEFVVSFRPAR